MPGQMHWPRRAYAPWLDMQQLMEERGIPLTVLESGRDLVEFDFVGFTLQHELSHTNIIKMMDLAGIPRFSHERGEEHPFIIAGGPCAYNVEPLADFFDFVVLGEGEEVINEILDLYAASRKSKGDKADFLRKVARLEGVYVPSFYTPVYTDDGMYAGLEPVEEGVPSKIRKRVLADMILYPSQRSSWCPMWTRYMIGPWLRLCGAAAGAAVSAKPV